GDGRIGIVYPDGSTHNSYEWFRAWQQLSNAGLIDGTYTGVTGSITGIGPDHANSDVVPGINAPSSKIPGAGFSVNFAIPTNTPSSADFLPPYGNHHLVFGARFPGWLSVMPVLTPAEAFIIDSKIDDGLPASGKIVTSTPSALPDCADSPTASVARYET